MLSNDDGNYLIKVAKIAIETYLKNKKKIDIPNDCSEHLKEAQGIFVTLNKNNQLRGCIGYPEPIIPLIKATIEASISAAVNDPRFPSLTIDEFPEISIELTILTKPKIIKVTNPKEYLKKLTIGKDGLIVEKKYNKGLLLPQVATENNMNIEEFLTNTCLKAGLDHDCWLDKQTKIYSFQGQIFK